MPKQKDSITFRVEPKHLIALDACSAPLGLNRSQFIRQLLEYLPESVDSVNYSDKGIQIISEFYLFEISCIDKRQLSLFKAS